MIDEVGGIVAEANLEPEEVDLGLYAVTSIFGTCVVEDLAEARSIAEEVGTIGDRRPAKIFRLTGTFVE